MTQGDSASSKRRWPSLEAGQTPAFRYRFRSAQDTNLPEVLPGCCRSAYHTSPGPWPQAIPRRARGSTQCPGGHYSRIQTSIHNDRIGTTLISGLGSETRLLPIPVTRKSFMCRGLGKMKTRILLVLAHAAIISLTLFATAYAGWNSRLFFETATVIEGTILPVCGCEAECAY